MGRAPFRGSPVWMPLWSAAGALFLTLCVMCAGVAFFGWALTWDLVAGIASPTAEGTKASPFVAWAISILGYVLVPVLIGLLVGGMAEIAVQSRLAPLEQREEEAQRLLEGKPENVSSSKPSGEAPQ